MSKRRQIADANLPLFDLPLQADGSEELPAETEAAPPAGAGPVAVAASANPVPANPGPASKSSAPGRIGWEPPAAEPDRAVSAPEQSPLFPAEGEPADEAAELMAGEAAAEDVEPWLGEGVDDLPLVQDRLLSGLADLVLLAVAVGSMVLGSQLLGVRVTLEDWPPFLVFGLLLSFPYAVIPLAFWGHTPGMAWVGHFARSVEGEPLTFGQTAKRWLGAVLTLALAGLPLLLAWRGGRSLADRLSESLTAQRPG